MTTRTTCRSCESKALDLVLSLGRSPLANSLLTQEELGAKEETFPLDLVLCRKCALLQITETVPPEKLFREYLYFSSFSDTMLKHADTLAEKMVRNERLGPKSLVVEVASNDGYLLQYYKKRGVPVLGIEPARNVAEVAEQKGVRTLSEFFGLKLADTLASRGEEADVIHANNVLAHVADLNGFVAGFERLLKDTGVAVIECPSARDFIESCLFDTIYHEHLCYYSLTALDRLMERHGLVIRHVEKIPLHGGSLQLYVSKATHFGRDESVRRMLEEEKRWGVEELELYRTFADRVESLKASLVGELGRLKEAGMRIAAYGAAAKGTTLLNYFGITSDLVEFAVDRSTYKQGRYIPGVRIPILAPEALVERRPDYCLLLTWNLADEILAQQKAYRDQGGKFIVPVPKVKVLA